MPGLDKFEDEPLVGVMPVAYGLAKIQHGLLQLLLQFVHLLLGGIDLLAKCVGVFFSGFLPGFLRLSLIHI